MATVFVQPDDLERVRYSRGEFSTRIHLWPLDTTQTKIWRRSVRVGLRLPLVPFAFSGWRTDIDRRPWTPAY